MDPDQSAPRSGSTLCATDILKDQQMTHSRQYLVMISSRNVNESDLSLFGMFCYKGVSERKAKSPL